MADLFAMVFLAVVSLALAAALCLGALWLAIVEPLHFLFWALAVAIVAMACHIGAGILAVWKWLATLRTETGTTGATHES